MGFFGKLVRGTSHVFQKAGSEVGHVFRKGSNKIARGLGSLAGGALGSMALESAAMAIAPELAVPALLAGGVIGKTLGGEAAGRIEEGTHSKKKAVQTLGNQIHNIQQRQQMGGHMPIPDGKFFKERPRLGQDGAGQRQGNGLEKMRKQDAQQRFI
jgi:hypothetical protein